MSSKGDDVIRGRRLIQAFSVAVIALEAYLVVRDGAGEVVSNTIRLLLVVLLCWRILAGSNGARWVTACLLSWGVLLRIAVMQGPPPLTTPEWVFNVLALLSYGGFAGFLVFSPAIQAYMVHRRGQRASV